jgi:hypothetical protein
MKKKKRSKAEQAAYSPQSEQTTDAPVEPPSCAFIGAEATGIRLEQARGIHICLDAWTSFHGEEQAVDSSLTIQEWTGVAWRLVETIRRGGVAPPPAAQDALAELDGKLFPGKYVGERVLALFKPAED